MRAYWAAVVTAIFAACFVTVLEACSCMPEHPQQHYCKADFVILARIKRQYITPDQFIYKIRIRKEFKMSEKARTALKSGRLITAPSSSLCGVDLKLGHLYLIAGHVQSLRAKLYLCDFFRQWKEVTKRQRKGFRRMYALGCDCRVSGCWRRDGLCGRAGRDECLWSTLFQKRDCQREEGICLRSQSKKCTWSKNAALLSCMRNFTEATHHQKKQQSYDNNNSNTNKQHTISLWSG